MTLGELNKGGFLVKNAGYWKRQHDKLTVENEKLKELAYTPKGFEWKDCCEQAEAEIAELTAQVAILRGYLLDVVELTHKDSQASWVARAGLEHANDQADKMLAVVRAAVECVDRYNAGEDWNPQFHAVSDVLFENIRLAVKAWKEE